MKTEFKEKTLKIEEKMPTKTGSQYAFTELQWEYIEEDAMRDCFTLIDAPELIAAGSMLYKQKNEVFCMPEHLAPSWTFR